MYMGVGDPEHCRGDMDDFPDDPGNRNAWEGSSGQRGAFGGTCAWRLNLNANCELPLRLGAPPCFLGGT